MAHCPPELLDDLADVLATIRGWPGVREKKLGVYYLRRTPLLHFHALVQGRVADSRDGRDWGERMALPYPASPGGRRAFLREMRQRYERTALALGLTVAAEHAVRRR